MWSWSHCQRRNGIRIAIEEKEQCAKAEAWMDGLKGLLREGEREGKLGTYY
jgi:hypothetical protein